MMLMPRQPVPTPLVPTLNHANFRLSDDPGPNFTMRVFYRMSKNSSWRWTSPRPRTTRCAAATSVLCE